MRFRVALLAFLTFISVAQGRETYTGLIVFPRAQAGSPAKVAFELFRSGRTTEALGRAQVLAAQGDGEALFLIGFALEMSPSKGGRGSSREQAVGYYYRRAGEVGSAEAKFRNLLFTMSQEKEDGRRKAEAELETAAKGEDPRACRILGEAWARGYVDGTADPRKAREWWSKAEALGDADVLVPLAALSINEGSPAEDRKAADDLLAKAVAKGITEAWLVRGDYQQMVRKDKEQALKCYFEGARAGDSDCMHRLAVCFRKEGNPKESLDWLKKAADAGNPDAAAEFGQYLMKKEPADLATAFHYLLAAAKDGVPKAQYEVAMFHLEGKLGERDATAAMAWLTKAISAGDPETMYQLAKLNELGIGGPINYSNAGMLYSLASRSGHAGAAASLARFAMSGIRVTPNPAQAWAFATLAAGRGDDSAKELLAGLNKQLDGNQKTEAEKMYAGLLKESQQGAPKVPDKE